MSIPYRRQLVQLAETLSAERQLLEQLLFKLVEARLILAADEAYSSPRRSPRSTAASPRTRWSRST
jgi:hypothetical protein